MTSTPAPAAASAPVSHLAGEWDLMSLFPQPCAFPCLLLPVKHPVINCTTLQPPKIYLELCLLLLLPVTQWQMCLAVNGSVEGITPLELGAGRGNTASKVRQICSSRMACGACRKLLASLIASNHFNKSIFPLVCLA